MANAVAKFQLAPPNWPESCGDVQIPYPFGINEGFYLKDTAKYFSINCDTSSSQPQPKPGNLIVTNISVHGEMDILMLFH